MWITTARLSNMHQKDILEEQPYAASGVSGVSNRWSQNQAGRYFILQTESRRSGRGVSIKPKSVEDLGVQSSPQL